MSDACVLIVDDDFDVRDSLKDILTDEGIDTATASDGFEALQWLGEHPPPALILLDWMMPRCDGAEFRRRQLAEPALQQIPVVLVTADTRSAEKRAALAIDDVLPKPVKLDRLLELVQKYCAGS
jgi:CheY-like chemotaxis protein